MKGVTQAGLTISIENNIQIIRFNNPPKKNAIQRKAYSLITKSLKDAAQNPEVLLTVLTGTGDYYSSGFDITGAMSESENVGSAIHELKQMIDALIDYPKLLVAIVNGPAIGLAVTTLGLCDIVYATQNATFTTPFSKLGLCAEGCASFTFPQILGKSKANEMLLVGHKMTSEEAFHFGFVSRVYKHSEIDKIWDHIAQYKHVSQQSILVSKKLTRNIERETLKRLNETELNNVQTLFESDDFGNAVIAFMTRKSKL